MRAGSTLVLTRSDVEALLSPDDCRVAVDEAFRAYGTGEAAAPAIVGMRGIDGGFHIKAGAVAARPVLLRREGERQFRRQRRARPGADSGRCRAVGRRYRRPSGAARLRVDHHVAYGGCDRRRCAAPGAPGCVDRDDLRLWNPGPAQLIALSRVRPIREVFAFDVDRERAREFAREIKDALGIDTLAVDDLRTASQASDIVATCTPSNTPVLFDGDVCRRRLRSGGRCRQ